MKIGGVTTARGSGRRSQSRRDRRCSSNTATSPSKISVEVGNNVLARLEHLVQAEEHPQEVAHLLALGAVLGDQLQRLYRVG